MEDRESIYQEAMNHGHSAAWDQNWDQAADFYRQAIEAIPSRVQAINNLGLAYFQLRRFKDAEACYKQAAKLSPEDPLAVERLAQISERTGNLRQAAEQGMNAAELYLKIKDVDKAIENWERVTVLIPEHLKAHSRLAVVYERLGHLDQAAEEYVSVAALLQDVGQVQRAVQTVEKAVQVSPENKEAQQALELVRANKTLQKPIRQRGATSALRMAAVRGMDEEEDEEEVSSEITNLSLTGPDPIAEARQFALTDLAGLLFEASFDVFGDPESTAIGMSSMFGASRDADFETISSHLGKAIDLQTRSQNNGASKELKKAIDLGLDLPAANFNLGLLYQTLNRDDKATSHLQRSLIDPKFALAGYLMLAQFFRKKRKVKSAARAYLEALREADLILIDEELRGSLKSQYEVLLEEITREENTDYLNQICDNVTEMLVRQNWRGHVSRTRKQMPTGGAGAPPIPIAEILLEAKDTHIVDGLARINKLSEKGLHRSAMEEAFILVTSAPTYLPLHVQMGELMLKLGNEQQAMDKFIVVSEAYASRGEMKRATNLLGRVVELSPMDYKARHFLVDRLVEVGETGRAVEESVKLGDVQYRLAQLDAARKTYEHSLRLAQQHDADDSWSVRILKQMADIDMQRLDWRQALLVFQQLRTLDQDDPSTRTRLVELNVRLGQSTKAETELDNFISYLSANARLEDAAAYLENLAEEQEKMVFVRSKLAEVYQQQGKVEAAIAELDKVAEKLIVDGEIERAKEAIRAILQMNPANADQYRAALQRLG